MADLKIVIDGEEYEVAMLASLNMAEAMLFYEYTKVSPIEMEDLTPPALAALLHIGIQRSKPMRDKQIREFIGALNMQELFLLVIEAFQAATEEAEKQEGEERPPTSPTPTGDEPSPDVVGTESALQQSSAPPSNGSSDHSPDLSDLSPTGTPV